MTDIAQVDQSRHLRNRHLFIIDVAAAILSPIVAFTIYFENGDWILDHWGLVLFYIAITVPLRTATYFGTGLYRRLWRHASTGDLKRILLAAGGASIIGLLAGTLLLPDLPDGLATIPLAIIFIDAMLVSVALALPRALARVYGRSGQRRRRTDQDRSVLIVGAGDTAKLVVKELAANPQLGIAPIGFVDDDESKHGHTLCDLPVLGALSDLKIFLTQHNIAEIIIAMPHAPGHVVRQVVRAALDEGVATRTVPSMSELLSLGPGAPRLREIEIQDLLRRDPVETDLASVAELSTGETVLVTGAGGSIGSELCRQIARLAPSQLVLLGHGENSIFDVQHELKASFPNLHITPVIADVRDRARIGNIFRRFTPHAVFHAAAHKHVPLMEENVVEAITNNVIGTRNVVDAAIECGTRHFVLISTDKAVRPTSVMGATKRVAELIVHRAALTHKRNFVSVRFGNVLGSRGSVVPTFLRQIRAGGPVTVTHPEMRRYFMTIPEAVQLVLQAGALGRGGEVFVLDMGEPIRVVDIATDLIRLSGLEVDRDIKISFTGMRPGEKLYEEMFFGGEHIIPTNHTKVLRANNVSVDFDIEPILTELRLAVEQGKSDDRIKQLLHRLVPGFRIHGTPKTEEPAARVLALHRPSEPLTNIAGA